MEPIPPAHEKSLRRSRLRLRVLLAINSLGEGYVGQIARLAAIPPTRVKWALLGRLPEYRPELSLVALGLVVERTTPHGRTFAITTAGRRKARSLVAVWSKPEPVREKVARRVHLTPHRTRRRESDGGSPDP